MCTVVNLCFTYVKASLLPDELKLSDKINHMCADFKTLKKVCTYSY